MRERDQKVLDLAEELILGVADLVVALRREEFSRVTDAYRRIVQAASEAVLVGNQEGKA